MFQTSNPSYRPYLIQNLVWPDSGAPVGKECYIIWPTKKAAFSSLCQKAVSPDTIAWYWSKHHVETIGSFQNHPQLIRDSHYMVSPQTFPYRNSTMQSFKSYAKCCLCRCLHHELTYLTKSHIFANIFGTIKSLSFSAKVQYLIRGSFSIRLNLVKQWKPQ